MLLLIYVDDILITGSGEGYIVQLITDLNSQFSLKISRGFELLFGT